MALFTSILGEAIKTEEKLKKINNRKNLILIILFNVKIFKSILV